MPDTSKPTYRVGDRITYRHGPSPDRMVEGYGRIIAFGRDGCTVESPDGRRCRVTHDAIVQPRQPDDE